MLIVAGIAALGFRAEPATAAPCAGFADVDEAALYCSAVEWLKNREVTLGCDIGLYCPAAPVNRASMALFMKRLGDALTPVVLHKEFIVTTTTVVPAAGQIYCSTDDYKPLGFPRTARFVATAWGVPNGGPSWLQGWWKYSTDGGTTWNYVGNWLVDQMLGRDWADYGQVANFAVLAPPMDLVPGTTYRFGLFMNGMGGAYSYGSLACQAEVTITGRTGAASPYDAMTD
ncbi:MAG: hypothetical protein U1F41_00400 [Burkholderiales bacterium]